MPSGDTTRCASSRHTRSTTPRSRRGRPGARTRTSSAAPATRAPTASAAISTRARRSCPRSSCAIFPATGAPRCAATSPPTICLRSSARTTWRALSPTRSPTTSRSNDGRKMRNTNMKRALALYITIVVAVCITIAVVAGCGVEGGATGSPGDRQDHGDNPLGLIVTYAQDDGRVRVSFGQALANGQAMFIRLRRGSFGTLDCADVMRAVDPVDTSNAVIDARHDPGHLGRTLAYLGPAVEPALWKSFYGPEWQTEPTTTMVADARRGTDRIIDTCLVSGFDGASRSATKIEVAVETDFDVAWDNATPDLVVPRNARGAHAGAHAGDVHSNDVVEQEIHSVQKYAEACVRD